MFLSVNGSCVSATSLVGVEAAFTEHPVNTAGRIGQEARLNCTIDLPPNDYLEWSSFVDGGTGERIFLSQDPDDVLVEGYRIDSGGNGKYDLILENIQWDKSGPYECKMLLEGDKEGAQFVALCKFSKIISSVY